MPRTVAFAFATAANTHIAQKPSLRRLLYTYYVSPERYLALDAIEELESQADFLNQLDGSEIDGFDERKNQLQDVLGKLDKGVTEGVREISGKHHVKFAAAPVFGIDDIQQDLLMIIADNGGEVESISELARLHGTQMNEDGDDSSYKKKIRYHVNENLEPAGLVEIIKTKKNHRVALSRIGEMWALANTDAGDENTSLT